MRKRREREKKENVAAELERNKSIYFFVCFFLTKKMCQICSSKSTLQCGACAQVEYCSEICATIHWNDTHQYECIAGGPGDDKNKKRERPKSNDVTWEEGDDDVFVLITEKNERVEIEKRLIRKSNTLKLMSADTDKEIRIPNIKIYTLRQIVSFLESGNIPTFKTDEHLYDFLNAAYYLDIIDFDYTDIMLTNDVFKKLKNLDENMTLSLDIVNRYLIPYVKVSLFKTFQKNNPALWAITARPFLLKLISKLFPKALAKVSEDELLIALYKYDSAIG